MLVVGYGCRLYKALCSSHQKILYFLENKVHLYCMDWELLLILHAGDCPVLWINSIKETDILTK